MKVSELLEKKKIFNAGFLFLINCLCILAVALLYIGRQKLFPGSFNINRDWLVYMTGIQILLSLLAVSGFQLMIYNNDAPIMGISYDQFFFTSDIIGNWNYSNCLYLLLEFVGISVICLLASNFESVPVLTELAGLIVVFCMVVSVFLTYRILFLGIVAKYKKSRLYFVLLRRMNKRRSGEKLYFQIRKDLDSLAQSVVDYKSYDEYLIEKLTIYIYMILEIEVFEAKIRSQEMMARMLMERIRWMIAQDTRKRSTVVRALKVHWLPLLSQEKDIRMRFGKVIEWIEAPKKMSFMRDFYTSFRYVWGQKNSGF